MATNDKEMTDNTECKICGQNTGMIVTSFCDRCWELNSRIRANYHISERIMAEIKREEIIEGYLNFLHGQWDGKHSQEAFRAYLKEEMDI